jgi:hypothetical protein
MGTRIINGDWPRTPSERAVKKWLDKIGVKETDLLGYEICAHQGESSSIKLELHFNEDVEE